MERRLAAASFRPGGGAALGFLAALVAAQLAQPAAHAGPWVPSPGEGYAKAWLKWLPGIGYHTGDGRTCATMTRPTARSST